MSLQEVSKNLKKKLVSNSTSMKQKQNHLDNIKAVYEISRIINHKPYTMVDVWKAYNDDQESKLLP